MDLGEFCRRGYRALYKKENPAKLMTGLKGENDYNVLRVQSTSNYFLPLLLFLP